MMKRRFRWVIPLVSNSLIFLVILTVGCQASRGKAPVEKPFPSRIDKIVVIGFSSAMEQGEKPRVIRSRFSGAVFSAEPVPGSVVHHMTAKLFDRLVKMEKYGLVSPAQAKGVFTSLMDSNLTAKDTEIFQKTGKAFHADAVLKGYIYRWRERIGTNYAVSRPASVALELYLISPENGGVLWKGRYDKTQRSLSENLLDVDTFMKGGGKWMTAEKLAEVGLDSLLGKWTDSNKNSNAD